MVIFDNPESIKQWYYQTSNINWHAENQLQILHFPLGGTKLWVNKENQSAVLQLICTFTTGYSLSVC